MSRSQDSGGYLARLLERAHVDEVLRPGPARAVLAPSRPAAPARDADLVESIEAAPIGAERAAPPAGPIQWPVAADARDAFPRAIAPPLAERPAGSPTTAAGRPRAAASAKGVADRRRVAPAPAPHGDESRRGQRPRADRPEQDRATIAPERPGAASARRDAGSELAALQPTLTDARLVREPAAVNPRPAPSPAPPALAPAAPPAMPLAAEPPPAQPRLVIGRLEVEVVSAPRQEAAPPPRAPAAAPPSPLAAPPGRPFGLAQS